MDSMRWNWHERVTTRNWKPEVSPCLDGSIFVRETLRRLCAAWKRLWRCMRSLAPSRPLRRSFHFPPLQLALRLPNA